jgi:hypothetical protein
MGSALAMPLTFTAPIEQVPEPAVVAFHPPDNRSAFEVRKTGGFPPLTTATADWMPPILKMTAEQAATLRGLAEATYELDAFKPKLSRAEADRRIATLSAKLKLLDGPPHTL